MWRFAFAAAALGLVAFACSSFDADPAPSPSDIADAADDGGGPSEAAADAAMPPFCATVDADFCWSFDEPAKPTPFAADFVDGSGFELVDASETSPPLAARIFTNGVTPANLSHVFAPGLSRVRCEAQIAADTSGTYTLMKLTSDTNDAYYVYAKPASDQLGLTLHVEIDPNGSDAGASVSEEVSFATVARGKFFLLALEFDANAGVVQVSTAGGDPVAAPPHRLLLAEPGARPRHLVIGPENTAKGAAAAQLRVDDIRCRLVQ